ncbi:MAG: 50S ribosomal protein L9 [Candidatus Cloacimonadota bacterium]|nr:50S ribosomal protein L9 [Candidatus Cloacimonadota bacterium]
MEVILTKDIKRIGEAGEIIKAKDGFARNYLLPKKLAIVANKYNRNKIDAIKKEALKEREELHNKYKSLVDVLQDVELNFVRKADENDHLFGSVSENDIVEALAEKDIELHRSHINLPKHLKELGSFDIEIEFTSDIKTKIKLNIEKE